MQTDMGEDCDVAGAGGQTGNSSFILRIDEDIPPLVFVNLGGLSAFPGAR